MPGGFSVFSLYFVLVFAFLFEFFQKAENVASSAGREFCRKIMDFEVSACDNCLAETVVMSIFVYHVWIFENVELSFASRFNHF